MVDLPRRDLAKGNQLDRYPSEGDASRAARTRSRPKAASSCSSIPLGIRMMTSIRLPSPPASHDLSTIRIKLPSILDLHQEER